MVQVSVETHKDARWQRYDTKHSPFLELQTPFTPGEAVKTAIMVPVAILRCMLALVLLIVLAGLSFIAACGWPLDQPFPPWRRNLVVLGSKFAGAILLAIGCRVRVRGWENVVKGRAAGALGLFNHTSYVDAVVMMWLLTPSGVSKASNADIPLLGTCIKAFQNIYVSRESIDKERSNARAPGGAQSVSQMIAARAKDRRFPMLVMAPEGTTGDGRCILQFRTGAFVPGVPVLPVCLVYGKRCHNPAWTIVNEPWHFLRLVTQFRTRLDIAILPPYTPSAEERADPKLYAANVRALYCRAMGLPLVEQSQEDYLALTRAGVSVSLDGCHVVAPPGVVDADGIANLTSRIKKRA
ncbi:hypothetical protein WJX81_004479 [Elliptochloris bilobata]|uniref:Phospholipid/glycerol acyltransferase domain-containing protein n=1 Tax=Elliptochloris bilobata TaxID=381761 RepID=A0AAW1RZR1_9CHLO